MPDTIPPEALLAGLPEPMPALAQELRALVRRAEPEAIEAVRPGWRIIGYDLPIGGRRRAFFAWIMAQREHVHLGFPRGILLADPEHLLAGDGITKLARWVTVRAPAEIEAEAFESLVREAAALAAVPRGMRLQPVRRERPGADRAGLRQRR